MSNPFKDAVIVGANINPDTYHNVTVNRGDAAYPVSASVLKLFDTCPARWLAGYEPPHTKSKAHGSALDCMLLTPHLFSSRYVVRPSTYPAPADHKKVVSGKIQAGAPMKWHHKVKFCSDWAAANADKEIISMEEYAELQTGVGRMQQDPVLGPFLSQCDRQIHVSGFYADKATGVTIPVRCLIDCVPFESSEFAYTLGDVKTTRCAHPDVFRHYAYRMGYHIQAAFDLDLFNAATGETRGQWLFALQENFKPWQTSRQMLSEEFIALGRTRYMAILSRYARCIATGHFPDYDCNPEAIQGWTLLRPTERMKEEVMRDWISASDESLMASNVEEMGADDTVDIIP